MGLSCKFSLTPIHWNKHSFSAIPGHRFRPPTIDLAPCSSRPNASASWMRSSPQEMPKKCSQYIGDGFLLVCSTQQKEQFIWFLRITNKLEENWSHTNTHPILLSQYILNYIPPEFLKWVFVSWSPELVDSGHTGIACLHLQKLENRSWVLDDFPWFSMNFHVFFWFSHIGAIEGAIATWKKMGQDASALVNWWTPHSWFYRGFRPSKYCIYMCPLVN